MKYECQVLTYGKPKTILKKLLKNIYQVKGDYLIGANEEILPFGKADKYHYHDEIYYFYPVQLILKNFDEFWQYKQQLNIQYDWQDVTVTICDKFSSFEEMDSTDFASITEGFCYYITLVEEKFDYFAMKESRFPIDTYLAIPKAVYIDFCTVVVNPDDTLFDELAQFFGINPY